MADNIPPDILAKIKSMAIAEWPSNHEMQQYVIESEVMAYNMLEALDFGVALEHKPTILKEAYEFHDTWEDIYSFVSDEVTAFNTLETLAPDDVPAAFVAERKREAAAEHDCWASQLKDVEAAIRGYRYVQRTRAKVGPIRDMLLRMEAIIGSECYNANIQNYTASGVWEGEGRSFRYPVTYIRNGKEEKRKTPVADLEPEELITGHYKFGANELNIFRALVRIVDLLEAEYDFKIAPD